MLAAQQVIQQLDEQGYAVLEGFLSAEQLDVLRLESELLYELARERAPAGGRRWGSESKASCIYEGLPGHQCAPEVRSSYEVYKLHRTKPPLGDGVWRIIFQSQLTELVRALLGPGAVLFNDQYIIKPAMSALSSFCWHRDSDWCRGQEVDYHPYISVWIALDDMSPDNGCFVVRPGSHRCPALGKPDGLGRAGAQGGRSQPAKQSGEMEASGTGGRTGSSDRSTECQEGGAPAQHEGEGGARHPPLSLCVPAGTAIVTSDTVLHCSGPNTSQHVRRAWMPQFSMGPITRKRDGVPVGLAVPAQR